MPFKLRSADLREKYRLVEFKVKTREYASNGELINDFQYILNFLPSKG